MSKAQPKDVPAPFAVPPRKVPGTRSPVRRYVAFEIRPDGSPTPYMLTEAGIAKVEGLAAEGVAIGTIAACLGIDKTTFAHIRKRQPEVQEAVDAGRAGLATELNDILMSHARNGNVVAAIFLAKTRGGFVEQTGEQEGASKTVNNTQVNIHLGAPLSDEQFAALLPKPTEPTDD